MTDKQHEQLGSFPLHARIWVLDNQNRDETARKKMKQLADSNQRLFVWPKNIKYKDFNEMCMDLKQNSVDPQFVLENSYEGMRARIRIF